MPNALSLPPVMPFRWACAYGEDRTGLWQAFEVAGVRQVMRWIPPGEFLMGSPESEAERSDDERQHRVVLTDGFWLADTACTQALWEAVMGANPSQFKDDPQNPVEQLSWLDITDEFLPKINALAPGLQLVLPTEAQWEYACRAGTNTPFSFGENVTTEQANYDGNFPYAGGRKGEYRGNTVPVKALPANPWGLHQMHGNVYEWCVDEYAEYLEGTAETPVAYQDKTESRWRVRRGGGWVSPGGYCRSAYRRAGAPDVPDYNFGFRLARAAC
jgi:formylglycine-generating enzyme required for sulfatase activity